MAFICITNVVEKNDVCIYDDKAPFRIPVLFCLIIIKVPECYWCDGSELNGLISGDGSPFILFCRHSLSNIENYSLFSPPCRHSLSNE